MSDWTLSRDQVRAIREARTALLDAAATGVPAALDRAVTGAVHAMWAADFSRTTICSLVGAAVDTGLPRRRGYAARADDVRHWTERAGLVADAYARGDVRAFASNG